MDRQHRARTLLCVRSCVCQCGCARDRQGHTCECVFLTGVYYILFVLLMLLASGGAIYIQMQNLRNTGFST